MTISRVEIQGQITNAHDFTNIKHHEDNKGLVQQNVIMQNNDEAAELKLHHVNDSERSENRQKKFDAREGSSNEYNGDGGQNRKRKDENPDGKVVLKTPQHGFDFRI